MTDDAAAAMSALRRQLVDGTLEAVEGVAAPPNTTSKLLS